MEKVAEVVLLAGELDGQVAHAAPKGVRVTGDLLKGRDAPALTTIEQLLVSKSLTFWNSRLDKPHLCHHQHSLSCPTPSH